jgi:hypothetical protein
LCGAITVSERLPQRPIGEPQPHPHRPLRGIPSSRAYWELKAEQMMNRIFDPDPTIDLPVDEPAPAHPRRRLLPPAPPRIEAPAGAHPRTRQTPVLLLSLLGGVCMVSAVSTVLTIASWNQVQRNLNQERNLLLVERLRSLGPANPAPAPAAPQLPAPAPVALDPGGLAGSAPNGDDLPPPPQEPWIEELSQLPNPERPAAPILRVPVSPRLAAAAVPPTGPAPAPRPAPIPAPSARPSATPVLVGVVAAAGRAGSAIFQVGAVTTSVGVGEAIGTSGWKLRAAGSDTAEIERDGEVRRVSISTGG